MVAVCLIVAFSRVMAIEELDAVIEFDDNDEFFKLVSGMRKAVVHLYSRDDKNYITKKKAFRRAAKMDIDKSE